MRYLAHRQNCLFHIYIRFKSDLERIIYIMAYFPAPFFPMHRISVNYRLSFRLDISRQLPGWRETKRTETYLEIV